MRSYAQALLRQPVRLLFRTPRPLLRLIAGAPRLSDEGVPLDLQTQALIGLQARAGLSLAPPPDRVPPTAVRKMMDRLGLAFGPRPASIEGTEEVPLPLPGREVRLRLYLPGGARPLPLTLLCHGGGYAIGSIEGYDPLCRFLARRAGCIVASVGYRLAPEHPFPAAVDDCVEAFRWLAGHAGELGADPDRIAVCGDSAGGTLATVVCLLSRPPVWTGARPCFQLLVYPSTDITRSLPSHETFGRGLVLTDELVRYFTRAYVPEGQDPRAPRLSPLFAPDLSGMPPARVYTAGFDMLRDEGRAYARRLRQAGVEVVHRELADQVHGFFNMAGILDRAGRALEEMAAALREALHGARAGAGDRGLR
jgi:acetyl esterase